MRKTMKRNKVKKHQKYSRKHKKTIKQKRQHKRGKYSKTLRGGDICLKEVTDKTPPEVNRIGDENTNLAKKTSWGFGSLFGNNKRETTPIETTPIETTPIEENKIIDENTTDVNRIGDENTNLPKKTSWGFGSLFGNNKRETTPIETNPIKENKIIDENTTDVIENPLLSSETEETSIVQPPLQPEEAGFVKPPPPSTPNPYLNTTPNKIEDTTIENSEIIEDSMSPPLPPVESKNPNNILDQIKQGVKLKSVDNSNIPPGTPTKDTNVLQQGLLEKFENTGLNKEEEEEEEEDINNTWHDSKGGKTRRRRRNKKSTRKNAKKVSKKR